MNHLIASGVWGSTEIGGSSLQETENGSVKHIEVERWVSQGDKHLTKFKEIIEPTR